MGLSDRIKHAWNAFSQPEHLRNNVQYSNSSSYARHKPRSTMIQSSSFANAIFNRIAMDVSMVDLKHVKIDAQTENQTPVKSGLQLCFDTEANIDQSNRQFMHDLVFSMFDEGVVAVVPVETTANPKITDAYEINQLRVGKIVQWYPSAVTVRVYNENTGEHEDLTLPKKTVAIIENPLYEIVNGDNATLKRLMQKMAILDGYDNLTAGGKLDIIFQMPHTIKTDLQKQQAKERLESIQEQLNNNTLGAAYIDGSEKITQLNRPINNKLLDEIQYLTTQFFNQLGLTQNVFNGTASEAELRVYYNRTIDPIIDYIIVEFRRKFLSKTARSQGHTITSYRDPFKLVPVEQVATISDTVTRNAILTPNEVRGILGYAPHNSEEADELYNRNIAEKNQMTAESGSYASPE